MKSPLIVCTVALLLAAGCKKKTETTDQATAKPAPAAPAVVAAPLKKTQVVSLLHMPAGCETVIQINTQRILQSELAKKHLVPQLKEIQKAPKADPGQKSFQDFLAAVGVDPLKDLDTVSVCLGPEEVPGSAPKLVTVLGGNFSPDTMVAAFREHSPKKTSFKDVDFEGGLKGIEADGLFTVQAKDAAPVFGTDRALVLAAALGGEAYKAYEIPPDHDIAIRLKEDVFKKLGAMPQQAGPFGIFLKDATTALLTVSLETGKLNFRFGKPDEAGAKAAAAGLSAFLKQMSQQAEAASTLNPQAAAIAAFTKTAQAVADGKNVDVTLQLPGDSLEGFFQQLSSGMTMPLGGPAMGGMGMPGAMPPGAMPPGAMPPGAMPRGSTPPGATPPGATK